MVLCPGCRRHFPAPAPGLRLPGSGKFRWSRSRLYSLPFPGGGRAGAGPCFSADGDSLAYIHPGADADSLAYIHPGADADSLAYIHPGATPTPWPTFTPAPTPWPRYSPGRVDLVPSASERPIPPTPYGKLHGGQVFLEKEALVAFWGGDLPDYLQDHDWSRIPESVKVVPSDVPYLLWVVAFDFTQAEPGYEMEGFIRWLSVPPGVQPIIMFEDQVTVSALSPCVCRGLRQVNTGTWNPGFYQVEFLDDRYQVVVHADFEVRS